MKNISNSQVSNHIDQFIEKKIELILNEKLKNRIDDDSALSMAVYHTEYLKLYSSSYKLSTLNSTIKYAICQIEKHFNPNFPISSLSEKIALEFILNKHSKAPSAAGLILKAARKIYDYALLSGYLDKNIWRYIKIYNERMVNK